MNQIPEFTGLAGAAFLLGEHSPRSLEFDHPEGLVVIREGAANVTVNLYSLPPFDAVKATCWRVVQESFDILAARMQAALTTSLGESAYVLWTRNGRSYDTTCVLTISTQWAQNAYASVDGAPPKENPPPFVRHEALRFYRMSQCARGLFDAYRNAYLALECLVSDESPKKRNERELEWLSRVIGGRIGCGCSSRARHSSSGK